MPDPRHYPDSALTRNPEHHENKAPTNWREDTDWLRLGVVVTDLKARVERAIAQRDEEAGSASHDDLISAEWRLRQSEGRKDG